MELEIVLQILLAAVLGGIIGLERELANKEAGLRTNILIAVGSTLITVVSIHMTEKLGVGDPGRLTAQIVSGIGFLGAGAIIQARFAVHGLTTAATIWTVAAIGITIGSGYYVVALMVTVFVVIVLTAFRYIASLLEKEQKAFAFVIRVEERAAVVMEVRKVIRDLGIRYVQANVGKNRDGFEIDLVLNASENKSKEFVEKVMHLKGVREISSESF